MNKYFTKEYIKECDCEEIRGLRKSYSEGDWFYDKGFEYSPIRLVKKEDLINYREQTIWLPIGDQLDEEIVKILDVNGYYQLTFDQVTGWNAKFTKSWKYDSTTEFNDKNPLIAKIKLLKELLNDN